MDIPFSNEITKSQKEVLEKIFNYLSNPTKGLSIEGIKELTAYVTPVKFQDYTKIIVSPSFTSNQVKPESLQIGKETTSFEKVVEIIGEIGRDSFGREYNSKINKQEVSKTQGNEVNQPPLEDDVTKKSPEVDENELDENELDEFGEIPI